MDETYSDEELLKMSREQATNKLIELQEYVDEIITLTKYYERPVTQGVIEKISTQLDGVLKYLY